MSREELIKWAEHELKLITERPVMEYDDEDLGYRTGYTLAIECLIKKLNSDKAKNEKSKQG